VGIFGEGMRHGAGHRAPSPHRDDTLLDRMPCR
jgi:hypothetical protein